jgi:signal transduction histidine kinase/CheY-like chemotaxis protein/CHASE3 domain sensor protein
MTEPTPGSDSATLRSRLPLPPGPLLGFGLAVVAVIVMAAFTYRSLLTNAAGRESVTHTISVIEQMQALLSTVKDAETAQRGFLLTGEETYLEPYSNALGALPTELAEARRLLADNPQQRTRLDALDALIRQKRDVMDRTINLRREGKVIEAIALVRTDRGRTVMEGIRTLIDDIQTTERAVLAQHQQQLDESTQLTWIITLGGSAMLLVLIAGAAVTTSADYRARRTLAWLRTGQAQFAARIQGEQRLQTLGENVLAFLADYLDAHVGAVYMPDVHGTFHRFAAYALPGDANGKVVRPGDGLLGQAAKANRPFHVTDVPPDYLRVQSALGESTVREILVAPAAADGQVHAVIELGFLHPMQPAALELAGRISEALGVAVRGSKDRTRLEELLGETQSQAEELQTQQEELRVSNEELEVQSRALKESQARLEAQQAELEQTNAQLEEQAQTLEAQRDDLERSQHVLAEKADELERANQYKSEFLANMSHELRTPLNSALILAKILADNKAGNLTEEQVKFAQTISSAGKDLLTLINDILDLSKIEAGKIEVAVESVPLATLLQDLVTAFEPVATQRHLEFSTQIEPGTPPAIDTDPHRVGQILKNLLSNALKFTESGSVSMRVSVSGGGIAFAVRDTGIGIPAHQQGVIFEAFRQADGSTHRKYGGTGLGLSISRDLARLLGGDVTVASTPNEGSVFTLTLPFAYAGPSPALHGARAGNAMAHPTAEAAISPAAPPVRAQSIPAAGAVEDDRHRLAPNSRIILIVEDDERFAGILRDLAHEMGFQCIVTHTAHDALAAASAYRPNAVLLDINLPDHSGLGVLDQLKRNPETRHIPVHVASVTDFTREALELGAVGYALKPVQREQLVAAFERLEAKLSQSMRRVLVVEDDARQRESIRQLLLNGDVEIRGVETAVQALAELKRTTFDCMVMDLNLPDLTGYELLEKMAAHEDVSFPPVIVYTGRSLTRDEEQRLRRFSRSIIIKDARSPERLLDEVTLFLHQVEAQLPLERQRMLRQARDRDAALDGRRILVVEDDVRNIFALSSLLEPKGAKIEIARNGKEALEALARSTAQTRGARGNGGIDLVLMDIMMPEMDGLTAMREIRRRCEFRSLPIIALTAKAMKDDQEQCLAAGANDYIAKPLDVEKLLSLVRVWMPK